MEDINFALVEDVRPPIYTAMKYWGKKPHNIWRKYIENYTTEDGLFLDPFAGSAISIFEAVKAGRKVIGFDLNPLTSFIVEVMTSPFEKKLFLKEVSNILIKIKQDSVYQKYFYTDSRENNEPEEVVCYKWDKDSLYELGIKKNSTTKKVERYTAKPNQNDIEKAISMSEIEIPFWNPNDDFPISPSFSANFIMCLGGKKFANLWTKRNLYILSKIFDEIRNQTNENIKKQLLFGFIQSLHLCTKMSVPRKEAANRDFSTSWGRSAYICSSRKMEMNALLIFKSSCIGKQSVTSCLSSIPQYLGKEPKIVYVDNSYKQKQKLTGFDIKYGIVDVNTILDYIPENSIDFIMTDPPYGGLVQYLDLSLIWLVWLQNINEKYKPNLDAEITIKKGVINTEIYKQRFTNSLKNLYKLLKPDGKLVLTFHNKQIEIWNAFLKSITLAGFSIEKVIHQQNRRTGDANVANPYGTSGTDFYIRCLKNTTLRINNDLTELEHFVLATAIEIIGLRNEPTPYQFLFNGLLAEISLAGYDLSDFDTNLQKILEKYVGPIFVILENDTNKAGNNWWFKHPNKYIKHPDRVLTDRVEESILALLRRKTIVSLDDVLGDIFVRYPNGLTPDLKSIDDVLMKFTTKSGGKYLYNYMVVEKEISRHTEILYILSEIGHKLGHKIFIGKKEQSELYKQKRLSEYTDLTNIDFLNYDNIAKERIEMIDMLWLQENEIALIIEVENTTKFTSGLQRASNLSRNIPKMIVLSDNREEMFLKIKDPLFRDNFIHYNWKYILYSDIEKIYTTRNITISDFNIFMKNI